MKVNTDADYADQLLIEDPQQAIACSFLGWKYGDMEEQETKCSCKIKCKSRI